VSGNGRIHRLVTVAWSAALLFALPQTVIFDMRWSARRGVLDCLMMFQPFWTAKLYVIWFTFAVYVLPFTTLTLLYTRVCFVVWKSRRLQGGTRDTPSGRRQRFQSSSKRSDCTGTSRSQENVNQRGHVVRRTRNIHEESSPQTVAMGSVGNNEELDGLIVGGDEVIAQRAVGLADMHLVAMSRDKIKTVKFTVAVIVSYLICWGIYFISLLYSLINLTPQRTYMITDN